jgi:hypothetical protein
MTPGFDDAVWAILTDALELYRGNPRACAWLERHLERFDEPLRIAVAGPAQSGKSTLINAIVGEEIVPTGGTRELTWYPTGATRALRHVTLIDTPGVEEPGVVDRVWQVADAVLYVTPHVPDVDLTALRAGQDSAISRAAPVNAILVLSRADEIGGGRVDALGSARLLARRYHRDPEVRPLCQTVVAVSGLVAHAGRTVTEREYAALAILAARPRTQLDAHLLSVDRFVSPRFPVPLGVEERYRLLDRFGLLGVRLATTLVRTGTASPITLSAQLLHRSGLADLRESVSQLFVERRHVLKARSALVALEQVVRGEPHPAARRLAVDLERALAGAHDLRELRLLGALRSGRTSLPSELDEEARRLVGAGGTGVAARLGLDEGTLQAQAWAVAAGAVRRWRAEVDRPRYRQDQRRAALTVVRSCEAVLADLADDCAD